MSAGTKFERKNFYKSGPYLQYWENGDPTADSLFIARFKYSARDVAGFKSFLIKHFTVEEYKAAMAAGKAPLEILEAKGYLSATVIKVLKSVGYPPTRQGFDDYIAAQVAKTRAQLAQAAS